MDFYDYKEELKKREYNLKCKIIRKTIHINDDAYDSTSGFNRAEIVILVPFEGTERDLFFTAYYEDAIPRTNGEGHLVSKVELPSYVAAPCSMPSMLRLNWPTEYFEQPHLLVMSVSMEKLLNTYKNIDTIDIRIFPYEMMETLGLTDGVMRI